MSSIKHPFPDSKHIRVAGDTFKAAPNFIRASETVESTTNKTNVEEMLMVNHS